MTHIAPSADNSHDPDRDTRAQILAAAQDLFLARGYKAVAMKDIAEAVHITSAALYYHFPQGKEEVLLETLRTIINQSGEHLRRAIAREGTFPERLGRIVGTIHMLPFDRLPLIMRDIDAQMPETINLDLARQGFESLQQPIMQVFQAAIDTGEIGDTVPAMALAQLFLGMILAASQNIPPTAHKRPPLANADEIIVTVLLHGITKQT